MEHSSLKIDDFERVEVNEAFAAQYIGREGELGLNREVSMPAVRASDGGTRWGHRLSHYGYLAICVKKEL